MTPLAHLICRTIIERPKSFYGEGDRKRFRDLTYDIHCFEVSKICDLAWNAVDSIASDFARRVDSWVWNWDDENMFLPFPKTWLEFKLHGPGRDAARLAFLLEEDKTSRIKFTVISLYDGELSTSDESVITPTGYEFPGVNDDERAQRMESTLFAQSLLVLINTPGLLGQKTFQPHRGLERELIRAQKLIGKFPLHAFTEIVLHVSEGPRFADGSIQEGRFTGERALHWVRAYKWKTTGIKCPAHLRGNPALGFEQRRYVVT